MFGYRNKHKNIAVVLKLLIVESCFAFFKVLDGVYSLVCLQRLQNIFRLCTLYSE